MKSREWSIPDPPYTRASTAAPTVPPRPAEEIARRMADAIRALRNLPMLGELTKLRSTQEYSELCEAWHAYTYPAENAAAERVRVEEPDVSLRTQLDAARQAAMDIIDAISLRRDQDFGAAWEHACLTFGRFGQSPTLVAEPEAAAKKALTELDLAVRLQRRRRGEE